MLASVDERWAAVQRASRTRESGQHGLFGTAAAPAPMLFELRDAEPWSEEERLASEYAMLGFYVSGHPLAKFASRLLELKCITLDQVEGQRNGKEITVAALIVGTRPDALQKGCALGHLHNSGYDRGSGIARISRELCAARADSEGGDAAAAEGARAS